MLTLLNGSATGQFINRVTVDANGAWTYAGGAPALLNNRLYVYSNYGFAGLITTTN